MPLANDLPAMPSRRPPAAPIRSLILFLFLALLVLLPSSLAAAAPPSPPEPAAAAAAVPPPVPPSVPRGAAAVNPAAAPAQPPAPPQPPAAAPKSAAAAQQDDESDDDNSATLAEGGDGGDMVPDAAFAHGLRRPGMHIIPLGSLFGGLSPLRISGGGSGGAPPRLHELLGSLERSFGGVGGQVMHIPSVLDDVLRDVMDGSAAGAFSGRNVDYSYSADRARLVARINLPPLRASAHGGPAQMQRRILHITVVAGGARLRVKVETLSLVSDTVFEHVLQLPVRVAQDGIETVANPDGSATVSLKIVGELSRDHRVGADGGMKLGAGSPSRHSLASMFFGDPESGNDGDDDGNDDVVQTLPSAADVAACRKKYSGTEYRLQARHCVCKTSPTADSRALCFAAVVSSAVKIARRLGKHDEATAAKHAAMECANHGRGHSECLEGIATKFLNFLYGDVDHGEQRLLSERLKTAIESEDDGPADRPRSSLWTLLVVIGVVAAALCCLGSGLFKVGRQLLSSSSRNIGGAHGQMSSVLSQRAANGKTASGSLASGLSKPRNTSGKLA